MRYLSSTYFSLTSKTLSYQGTFKKLCRPKSKSKNVPPGGRSQLTFDEENDDSFLSNL